MHVCASTCVQTTDTVEIDIKIYYSSIATIINVQNLFFWNKNALNLINM